MGQKFTAISRGKPTSCSQIFIRYDDVVPILIIIIGRKSLKTLVTTISILFSKIDIAHLMRTSGQETLPLYWTQADK